MIKRLVDRTMIKFIIVGIINTIISYSIFSILTYCGIWYIYSNLIGYVISVANSYVLNKFFVFKQPKRSLSEMVRFLSVYIAQYIICVMILFVCVDFGGLSPYIAGIFSIFVGIFISYVGHKCFTYRTT